MKLILQILILTFVVSCASREPSSSFFKNPFSKNDYKSWQDNLEKSLKSNSEQLKDGNLGVYVFDPENDISIGLHQDRNWYLASTIKIPVAIEVLKQIEDKKISYDTQIKINPSQKRDGAGEVSYLKAGTFVSVRYLLEQMLLESDNAATDILIGLVGIDNINRTLKKLVPVGFQPITSLLDVRRYAFKELHPFALKLSAADYIKIKSKKTYSARYNEFARLIKLKPKQLKYKTIDEGFEAYYKKGANSSTLKAFAELLTLIHKKKAVSPFVSTELNQLMLRCRTGGERIKAGLPAPIQFAHKTGTQVARVCDNGIITFPDQQTLIVVACVEKWKNLSAAEKALSKVGKSIDQSMVYRK